MAEGQHIVAVFLDGTLNVDACGPYRSLERAREAARRINDAGEWTVEDENGATILAQVVTLSSVADLVDRAEIQPSDEESYDHEFSEACYDEDLESHDSGSDS
ncbi:hypothetical protein ACI2IX_19995 [Leifsonia aquatica]|uniref:hypothetical protein n=1 Tax=Leifsonia aquatica TaxID=144185 RepID=UPI00384C3945